LELYRVFYITAKAGSISRAAKELFITQPAVSQSIKQLEDKLGGQLFFRTQKGIVLTQEGTVLFKYIEQAYNFILTAEKKFAEMQNLMSGEINIGASDTLCKYHLVPFLEKFHKKYPNLKIRVTNRTSPETVKLLKSGKVDLGIINLPFEDNKLKVEKEIELTDCFIVGEAYKELSVKEVSIEDLIKYPLLLLEKDTSSRNFINAFFEKNNVKVNPEIELGSIDLLIEFTKIGMGVSCVVSNFIDGYLKDGSLFRVRLKEEIPKRSAGIVSLKSVPVSAAGREFISLLK
jgi:LysR family cyn operon transcriptional activator